MNKRLLTALFFLAAMTGLFAQTTREPLPVDIQWIQLEEERFFLSPQNAAAESGYAPAISAPVPLSRETAKILENIEKMRDNPPSRQTPKAFAGDLQAAAGDEPAALGGIVRGAFAKREWDAARTALLQYLSLPQTEQAEAKARYYLGQTYYFSGQYRDALLEFLCVRTLDPNEVDEWIDATLTALTR